MMIFDFSNKVAVVTGATGGIGQAITGVLYSMGASLTITGRSMAKLTAFCDKLKEDYPSSTAPRPLCVPADLAHPETAPQIVNETVTYFGKLDILVNNAAAINPRLIAKMNHEYLSYIMQINFRTPYELMRCALPVMSKNKYGRIINLTSIAGIMGDTAMSAYSSSKGALASATKSIAIEYGRRNITANCVAPGIIETQAIEVMNPSYRSELLKLLPLRRFGNPIEVAHTVAFLASEYASYITGQQIHVNGGLLR